MSAAHERALVERALERARRAGADAADALIATSDSLETRVRGDEIDHVVQARQHTLGIRALVRGTHGVRSAVTSTSDLDELAVDRLAAETVALARATAEDPAAGLPDGDYDAQSAAEDLGLYAREDQTVSVEARIEEARAAEAAARALDPRIANSEGSQAASDFRRVVYGSTAGFLCAYESASHSLFCEPLARENGAMQRDFWLTVARRRDALEAPAAVGRRAAERAVRRLGARRVPTCEVPVIFDPITAPSLISQVAALASGYSVYRKTSCLAERLDDVIASELITIVDDGRRRGGLGTRPFDGEGLPTRRTELVTRGRLSSWLLDSYSARKLGLRSTGNAARGAGSAPGVAATNLWLEPGAQSAEQIIASTPRGLLVTELIGMGFNPVTGDYSRGAVGFWIEGGEIAYPVEEITIAGNLLDMLRDVDAVGSDLLWLSRVAAPTLRVSRMTVAGS